MTRASNHAISFKTPRSGAPGEVFGIDIAIVNFVRAYCRHTRQEHPLVIADNDESWKTFTTLAKESGIDPARCRRAVGNLAYRTLAQAGTLFSPDPMMNNWFWYRARLEPGYAVCGLTHTMTGSNATGVVANYLTDPSAVGDALICPSLAIRDAIKRLFEIHGDYLGHRFSTKITCPVELPVIPLAIDTARYAGFNTPQKRAAQRAALSLADDDTLILSFGRISHYTKAHPLPLFMGAERAAQNLKLKGHKGKLHVVCLGFFSPAGIEPEVRALAADICKTVTVDFIDKADPRFPEGLWAAADIFTSLVDNYQESFGLTPIEAMAAGVPSVITNWDGYRDGVRHGTDGFQIPTSAPPPQTGLDLAFHAFNGGLAYGEQLAAAAQSVAVDIDVTAAAFELLASDPARRKAMGAAAQQRALSTYDWAQIIPAYEDLWDELAAKRRANLSPALPQNWPAMHTTFPDLYAMFESFPSHVLAETDVIVPVANADEIELILRHKMNHNFPDFLLPLPQVVAILTDLHQAGRIDLKTLLVNLQAADATFKSAHLWRTVGWMLKNGFIALDSICFREQNERNK